MSNTNHLLPVSARIPAGKKQEYVSQAIKAGLSVGEYVAMVLTNYDLQKDVQGPVVAPKSQSKTGGDPSTGKKLKDAQAKLRKAEAKLKEQGEELTHLRKIRDLAQKVEAEFFSGRTSERKRAYQDMKYNLGIKGQL